MPLPALITSGDLLPGGGALNGRRWAGQQLIRAWAHHAGERPMALAHADPAQINQIKPWLQKAGFQGELHGLGLVDPEPFRAWGGLFLPDPSIGRWAQWRQPVGPAAFSLIGQIHTLSTPAALGHLQDLVADPVHPWDALICSSSAGQQVVETVLDLREEQLLERSGGSATRLRERRPQLPVIPLPLPPEAMESTLSKAQARAALGLSSEHVVLWLGRLSFFTKLDPWPTYCVLERVAQQLDQPLVLLECGPDDQPSQHPAWERLRQLCPSVRFVRLGGEQPVSELVKRNALAAADVAISLVDNAQETFGLAVAEAMAAGLPSIVSDWNGYRDLVRHGTDGFRIASRWSAVADAASVALGWQQFTGLVPFTVIAGAMAQLVELDLAAAEAALLTLLRNPRMASAMGAAAQSRAKQRFAAEVVLSSYERVFSELEDCRRAAPQAAQQSRPAGPVLDLVRVFNSYASTDWLSPAPSNTPSHSEALPPELHQQREAFWSLLRGALPESRWHQLDSHLLRKHACA